MLRERASPNHDARNGPVTFLVLHYTGMRTAGEALDRLCDPVAEVSSHYVVEEDGTVWRLVDEARRAWHAGVSFWRGETALNARSIGIEIVNPGHEHGYVPFPQPQMRAVTKLCRGILARHPIAASNVVAHSDIAPDRKEDPGELFDWRGLAAEGIGIWPAEGADEPVAAADVAAVLAAIGYRPDLPRAVLLRAFQRHWCQQAVNGEADLATRTRLAAVLAAVRTGS
ncbi:MAG: N-acetylmuramoyl-L-alanine amidase [Rhodospirillales bacterium]|nr:N-acetylmuramoyl-L-alanine amidase [Rhodospirillales bacterium]